MTQNSAPKIPKVWTFEKVPQKFQNSGGGVGPLLEEVHKKGAFFLRGRPLEKPSLKKSFDNGHFPRNVGG